MPKSLDDEIQAHVTSVCYKPQTRTGYLRLEHMHVPDMTGTIKLYTRISREVEHILVYDGRHLNTRYDKLDGKWRCTGKWNTVWEGDF